LEKQLPFAEPTSISGGNALTTLWAAGLFSEEKVGTTRPNMGDEIDVR